MGTIAQPLGGDAGSILQTVSAIGLQAQCHLLLGIGSLIIIQGHALFQGIAQPLHAIINGSGSRHTTHTDDAGTIINDLLRCACPQ